MRFALILVFALAMPCAAQTPQERLSPYEEALVNARADSLRARADSLRAQAAAATLARAEREATKQTRKERRQAEKVLFEEAQVHWKEAEAWAREAEAMESTHLRFLDEYGNEIFWQDWPVNPEMAGYTPWWAPAPLMARRWAAGNAAAIYATPLSEAWRDAARAWRDAAQAWEAVAVEAEEAHEATFRSRNRAKNVLYGLIVAYLIYAASGGR